MRKYLFVSSLLSLLLAATPVLAQTVTGNVTMEFDLSGHGDQEVAQLWIPYPVSSGEQTISNIQVEGNFSNSGVYTDKTHTTPMLYARWEAGKKERKLSLSFHAERNEVIRRDFPKKETAWDPADYAAYLAPTSLGPIDGEVKRLADKITKGKSSVLAKAKAIYDWACENTYRNLDTRGCGTGDVCKLLQDPGGKCADISSIYVALARAAGVPSREILGIRLGKTTEQDISTWQHCWAEFYLPGYGWVPVDPADVRKMMLVNKLQATDAKTIEYRNYFWGGIDPYRIKLGEGRDLKLNPPQQGMAVNYLMYPFGQVGGKTLDWLDPASFKYTITYRQ